MKLVLASGSPRRADVLRNAGIVFDVLAANVDETRRPDESAADLVQRLAHAKAQAAAEQVSSPAIVIGADTAVVVNERTATNVQVLGKPTSAQDARNMLQQLSGRTHTVLTGLALSRLPDQATRAAVEATLVTFAPLSQREIQDYVASGEPLDKAGAYAIQGRGGRFVTRIEGCYFNVIGLPLARLYTLLHELGWSG